MIEFKNRHAIYICERMRTDEIEQYVAFSETQEWNPEVAAAAFIAQRGLKFTILGPDGYPAASGGYFPVHAGVMQSWMCGTEDGWRTSWRAITQGCRWLADGLFDGGGTRRLQTIALASRTQAHEWYERGLGMRREGTFRQATPRGEDVAHFARIAGE